MDRIVAARVASQRGILRVPWAFPLAIFALTMAVTLLGVFAIERAETERRAVLLRASASVIGGTLERFANADIAYLRAGAAVLAQTLPLTAARFDTFAAEVAADGASRGAYGIGWAETVAAGQVAALEARARREGAAAFAVQPDAHGDELAVVRFLAPLDARNARAIGFDMMSDAVRRAALVAAAAARAPTASGPVVLIQDRAGGGGAGFLVFMPVFPPGGAARPAGFLYSPFNAHHFLASALALERSTAVAGDIDVSLYDGAETPGALLTRAGPGRPAGQRYAVPVTVASRRLLLVLQDERGGWLSPLALVTLIFGTLVALLLLVLGRVIENQAADDRAAQQWLSEQASIRNSLTREVNHRAKNMLANVLSIIALTRRRAAGLDDFADGLQSRIRALSATHDLLTEREWGAIPLGAVIHAELAPYVGEGEAAVEIAGPEVMLAPNDALSLGLALHELAANAAKFGALSTPEGRVAITWELTHAVGEGEAVRLAWRERGGPPVAAERRRGFGTELLERIIAHELDNPVDLRFDRAGVSCVLTVQVRVPAAFQIRRRARGDGASPPRGPHADKAPG